MILPDKWVRKAIYDTLNEVEVSGRNIYVFDLTAPNYFGDAYVIISTQTNTTIRTKCGSAWLHTCELQVVTRDHKNNATRLIANDVSQTILTELTDLTLSASSGLKILDQDVDFPTELVNVGDGETIIQQIIRYTFRIN